MDKTLKLNFGKYKGQLISKIEDLSYLEWLQGNLEPDKFNNKEVLKAIAARLNDAPRNEDDDREESSNHQDAGEGKNIF